MASALARRLVPLMDRVLVQKLRPAAQTKSGLFLPEGTKAGAQLARVLAVGPGAVNRDGTRAPLEVAAGDTVVVPEYGGMPVKIEDEEFQVFRNEDLVAIVKDAPEK